MLRAPRGGKLGHYGRPLHTRQPPLDAAVPVAPIGQELAMSRWRRYGLYPKRLEIYILAVGPLGLLQGIDLQDHGQVERRTGDHTAPLR